MPRSYLTGVQAPGQRQEQQHTYSRHYNWSAFDHWELLLSPPASVAGKQLPCGFPQNIAVSRLQSTYINIL